MPSRSRQRRRLQRWERYVSRYAKPPHGYLGVVETPGRVRALARARRWRLFASTADLITYRRSMRTTPQEAARVH